MWCMCGMRGAWGRWTGVRVTAVGEAGGRPTWGATCRMSMPSLSRLFQKRRTVSPTDMQGLAALAGGTVCSKSRFSK